MNIIGCLLCALGLVSVMSTIDAFNPRNTIGDEQLYDPPVLTDISSRVKRPFCNAFTGCGRKRSFYPDNSMGNQEQSMSKLEISVPFYRALLHAASRDVRHNLDRDTIKDHAYQIYDVDYSDRNEIPSGKRYQMS